MYKFGINIFLFSVLALILSGCVEQSDLKISIASKAINSETVVVNSAPILDSISNQTVPSGSPITTVDAAMNAQDVDSDGDVLTYSCFYDTALNGSVSDVTSCTSLSGVSFSTTTGIMNWTPALAQLGIYEFKIVASDGSLTDEELFSISVNNNNTAPVLDSIADIVINENTAIATVDAGMSGVDIDGDGDALNYTCFYDTTVNGTVASTSSCTSLTGVTFSTSTGEMDWTPGYTQSGNYEFKITGSDGSLSDDEIFSITVNNVNRAPVLDAIADETVSEGIAITTVDADDSGADLDIDGQAITYSCYVDTNINSAVASTTACSTISGINFTASTGVMNWMPDMTQSGSYEFKIVGSDGSLSDDEIFSITVTEVNQAPALDSITNQTINEGSALTTIDLGDGGDDFDADGDALTYECRFDNIIDWGMNAEADCSTIPGMSFSTTTGIMNWTPDYNQAGDYEFLIITREGTLHTGDFFTITVNNVNRGPSIDAIANQTITANSAMTTVNVNDGGDDFDADGDALTYSCYYDTVINGSVAVTNSCTSLSGVTFSSTTGVMDWTPTMSQVGPYEFRVVAQETSLSSGRIFTVTVGTPASFVFLLRTTVANRVIVLPVGPGGNYNFTVNYGDGSPVATVTSDVDSDNTHTYVAAGDYTVTITGLMSLITFENNSNARAALIKVIDLGETGVTNLAYAFKNCSNLTDFAGGNTSKVTTMYSMFMGAGKLANADFSTFDTSKVTDMGSMFQNTTLLLSLNVSNFNTAAVTNMSSMFYGKTNVTSLDLSNFNTANVTDMSYMFYNNTQMTSYNLSSFNTAKVTNMTWMFYNNIALTSLDLSSFRTPEVTNMAYMFNKTTVLASLDLSAFNTAKVTTMAWMFAESGITTLNVSGFNTLAVIDMSYMFYAATKITSLNLASFVTSNVTTMASMFSQTTKLATLDIQNFNTSKVTSMSGMFASMPEITSLDLSHFDTTLVTNMSNMFQNTSKLNYLDISSFITGNVLNMSTMFNGTNLASLDLSHFNTVKVTTMANMFQNTPWLTSLNLTNFNTANVTSMSAMFHSAGFTSVDLSMLNTIKVTDMSLMFYNSSVTNLNLSSFNTSAVTNMSGMFQFARFTSLNVSSFNTSAVTTMNNMFFQAGLVPSLNLSNFNTGNVTNMTTMFQGTASMLTLNTTGWDLTKASASTGVFTSANAGLVVTCNQGGPPATGTFFGKACN